VDQDVSILGSPPWLLTFVLESVTQRVCPRNHVSHDLVHVDNRLVTIYFGIVVFHVSHPSSG